MADQLRGRHAARRRAARAAAGSARELAGRAALGTLLAGVLSFFLLEKLVLWRHCHDAHECEVHTSSAASLVIVGDAFHTFVDGAVIAAAVVTSIPLGITTALAVAAHEIPQEVGDVAILLRAGYSRGRAFTLNLLSGIGGILGAVAMLAATAFAARLLPYVLAFAAGNFLYVAMADLIPDLHRGGLEGGPVRQLLLIGAGILTIVAALDARAAGAAARQAGRAAPLTAHSRRLRASQIAPDLAANNQWHRLCR